MIISSLFAEVVLKCIPCRLIDIASHSHYPCNMSTQQHYSTSLSRHNFRLFSSSLPLTHCTCVSRAAALLSSALAEIEVWQFYPNGWLMKLFMILDFDSSLFGFFAYEILFPCGAKRKKYYISSGVGFKGSKSCSERDLFKR